MSFECIQHGWRHLFNSCPLCSTQTITTEYTGGGTSPTRVWPTKAYECVHIDLRERVCTLEQQLTTLREALKRSYTALQYEIIRHNGPVPGLTDEQLFDEAILTQQNTRDALKKCFGEEGEK